MGSRSDPDLVYHLLAPALLILTPFISFVTYNHYSYTTPEIWICLAGLAAIAFVFGVAGVVGGWPVRVPLIAGLLVLWFDLQSNWLDKSNPWPELRVIGVFVLALMLSFAVRRHLSRIVTAVFATMLVATVAMAAVGGTASRESSAGYTGSGRARAAEPGPRTRSQLPILVHLVLDEHIGIEGIPDDVPHGREMREFLRDFFDTYDFRVFGHAYSHYDSTFSSLPNLVNLASDPLDGAFTSGVEPYVRLLSNKYFERLGQAGYNIHVYQMDIIDYCAPSRKHIVKCASRKVTGLEAMETADMPVLDKVTLIYRRFADLSALKTVAEGRYRRMRQALHSAGWTLPEWWLEEGRLGPIPDMALFDGVTADVAAASPGDMFFVHLLMPHSPYSFNAACDVRPVREWDLNREPPPMPPNDRNSRAARYGLYLEQMRCLYRKLDAMFQAWQKAGVFTRSVIVVHGDHGSRIYRRRPVAKNSEELTRADYVDSFSTLFAVKGPRHSPGYDRQVASIRHLLGEVVGGPTGDADVQAEPYVLLSSGPAQPMVRRPLPAFGNER